MNAFKAFKAQVPIAWSPNLYITLVRGIPGTRRLHRRTLEALRLRKCNRTVMRWNTPTVRGMIQQVKRLVVVETEEMFNARKQNLANHRAIRPPLVVLQASDMPHGIEWVSKKFCLSWILWIMNHDLSPSYILQWLGYFYL